ncbi:MAG: glycoside hydrolase family 99-like domain-containing protein [Candidatus Hydrogenedentota bacterium]
MEYTPKARLIANYLPQFHPIPENNEWWGEGFTEWTNVTKAKPLFSGHYQPHTPADLGFCDLRIPETRIAQAEMARTCGIEAFCYWHYWFAGKMLIERPLQEVVKSGEPNFPFCVAWANESWTGVWHGAKDRLLMEQTYPGKEDYVKHFEYLLPMFSDERYLTVDGKPLFMLFRPDSIPNAVEFVDLWKELAVKAGLKGLHIIAYKQDNWPGHQWGFDGATWAHQSIMKWVNRKTKLRYLARQAVGLPPHVYRYKDAIPCMHGPKYPDYEVRDDHYPSIVTGWDNSPRSGKAAMILTGYTPELFRVHVRNVLDRVKHKPMEHRIVFVKSWNEWAEGNYLEPDLKYGKAFLEVLREEVCSDIPLANNHAY